jgi:ribosomal RNA-processing protein 12
VHTADVYRAKKGATGDAFTKERTLEPYAYWPLDAKLMNRRAHKRRSASEKLGQVVTKAKGSGIHHGQKAKDAKRRKK